MNKKKQCSEADRSVHNHLLQNVQRSAVWFMSENFLEEEKRLITPKWNHWNQPSAATEERHLIKPT